MSWKSYFYILNDLQMFTRKNDDKFWETLKGYPKRIWFEYFKFEWCNVKWLDIL